MSPPRKKKNRMSMPVIFVVMGAILVVLAVIWTLSRNPEQSIPAPQVQSEEIPYPEIQRVSLADARAANDNSTAIFVDVRDAIAYIDSHISGALSIPLAELEGSLDKLPRTQWIITYCT